MYVPNASAQNIRFWFCKILDKETRFYLAGYKLCTTLLQNMLEESQFSEAKFRVSLTLLFNTCASIFA